jgi:hypothetical protein
MWGFAPRPTKNFLEMKDVSASRNLDFKEL